MPMNKEHKEFHAIDMANGWSTPDGYPEGIQHKILAGRLDEQSKTGNRTRLLRFARGAFTSVPFVHDYWEEVIVLDGDLIVEGKDRQSFGPLTYACRPPGISHGPFSSRSGCLLFEIHYYDDRWDAEK